MAYTKKSNTSTTEKVEKVEKVKANNTNTTTVIDGGATKALQDENASLKKSLEELQTQMAVLMKSVANGQDSAPAVTKTPERNITFINLTPGTFVLKGSQIWLLEGQFTQKSFLEREARIIVNNMHNAIHNGNVYIADAQFVEDNDLSESYRCLLDNNQLKALFNEKSEYVIEMYKTVSPAQQEIIIQMIVDKLEAGGQIDGNILVTLGKLSGKDLVNTEPLE